MAKAGLTGNCNLRKVNGILESEGVIPRRGIHTTSPLEGPVATLASITRSPNRVTIKRVPLASPLYISYIYRCPLFAV
jgi:hypothetical protein